MSEGPLMPKATAVWLVENTSLSFDQIADFCKLHPLEVKGIADGEVAVGIKGLDPIGTGPAHPRRDREGRRRDPNYRLRRARKVKLPEHEAHQEGAALYAGVAPPGPPERDPLASAQPSGVEGRADHASGRHHQDDHPAGPRPDPLELREPRARWTRSRSGCARRSTSTSRCSAPPRNGRPWSLRRHGQTLLPAEVSTAPEPRAGAVREVEPPRRPQEDEIDVELGVRQAQAAQASGGRRRVSLARATNLLSPRAGEGLRGSARRAERG